MASQCRLCLKRSEHISNNIGVCLSCIRTRPSDALKLFEEIHKRSRIPYDLPEKPPRAKVGEACGICVNRCRVPEGECGYCGLKRRKPKEISPEKGKFLCYHDPLPTNCVAGCFCPGGTGAGYPRYSNRPGPEKGFDNLAVYFQACNFNCLFCQNWEFRQFAGAPPTRSRQELLSHIDDRTSCISFFGGDPTPQLPFALGVAQDALERKKGRILRICWETNGSMERAYLDRMVELSMVSGGCVKFDLKAWDENLHIALTGVTNRKTLENFRRAARRFNQRPVPPLLIAATCLVPGYIDEQEIRKIAGFIASVNSHIPYVLLGFSPEYLMADLPPTAISFAKRCLDVAREEGLKRVRMENFDDPVC